MSLPDAERFARLRLARADRVGPVSFRQLLDRFGSAVRALDALPDPVRKGGSSGYALPPTDRIEAELAAGEKKGARLLVFGDADYPPMLAAVDPPPPLLWTLGDVALLSREAVGVVGASPFASAIRCAASRSPRELTIDASQRYLRGAHAHTRAHETSRHKHTRTHAHTHTPEQHGGSPSIYL